MKKFVALGLLLLLQTSGSALASQTQIQIEPVWPVNCSEHDYPVLNAVSQIQKVDETDREATFTFRTIIGACDRGAFLKRTAITNEAHVATWRNKIVLFGHEPVVSEIQVLSGSEAQVTLTFDKKAIFKKKDRANFTMMFYPQGNPMPELRSDAWGRRYWVQRANMYFPWEILLSETESGCRLSINVH